MNDSDILNLIYKHFGTDGKPKYLYFEKFKDGIEVYYPSISMRAFVDDILAKQKARD